MWLEGAGCCLTCHSAHVRMAGCGLTSPCACGRWLPVWLPEILLVTLTLGCPGHDAGAARDDELTVWAAEHQAVIVSIGGEFGQRRIQNASAY